MVADSPACWQYWCCGLDRRREPLNVLRSVLVWNLSLEIMCFVSICYTLSTREARGGDIDDLVNSMLSIPTLLLLHRAVRSSGMIGSKLKCWLIFLLTAYCIGTAIDIVYLVNSPQRKMEVRTLTALFDLMIVGMWVQILYLCEAVASKAPYLKPVAELDDANECSPPTTTYGTV